MSKKTDRLSRLIDIIKTKNGATVKELASLLDVSEMTIRRDLAVLEQNSIVNNVYGAAIYNPSYDSISDNQKEDEASITSPKGVASQKDITFQQDIYSWKGAALQKEPAAGKGFASWTEAALQKDVSNQGNNPFQKDSAFQNNISFQKANTFQEDMSFQKANAFYKDISYQKDSAFHKDISQPKDSTYRKNDTYKNIENNPLYELNHAKNTQDTEKKSIGAFAASYINNGDIIVIDTGSTTEMLAENIPDDLEATILCYNANILNSLRLKEKLTLIFSGGKYHPTTQMVESPQGVELIKSMRFTKAFISAAGIHAGLGVTCVFDYEVATKKAIMDSSVEKILLFDSSKFNQVKPAYFGDLTDFDVIITDNDISDEWRELINSYHIKLYTVPV